MKYATFGSDGQLNGRYDSIIHKAIPVGAVDLSDDLFLRTINETDGLWTLLNGVVTKVPRPAPAPQVPTVISMRQARRALFQSSYLTQIDALIAAMPGADGDAARIDWNYATEVRRDHPLVPVIAAELSLTSAQLDDLFTVAATL